MFDLFLRMTPFLCITGGVLTGIYGVYALIVGRVVVESRATGASIYLANVQSGPFYGFVAFYLVCALIFVVLGFLAKKDVEAGRAK